MNKHKLYIMFVSSLLVFVLIVISYSIVVGRAGTRSPPLSGIVCPFLYPYPFMDEGVALKFLTYYYMLHRRLLIANIIKLCSIGLVSCRRTSHRISPLRRYFDGDPVKIGIDKNRQDYRS